MIVVRLEAPADRGAVFYVNECAFGRPAEALLVDRLRASADPVFSFVAEEAGQVVGHILFSPVEVASEGGAFPALGLAPMAVLPARQRRGIGSRLVRAGLRACRDAGRPVVFVLGHPGYYPRFGFTPAHAKGITCTYDVPPDAFMVAELVPGALAGRTGTVHYHPAFEDVT